MKYVVLGPIGLIEFLVRFILVFGLCAGTLGVLALLILEDHGVEGFTEMLTPFCWKLLDDRPVNLRK